MCILICLQVKSVVLVSIVWYQIFLTSRLNCTKEGAYGEPITGPYCAWRHVSINSRSRWLGVAQYLVDRSTPMRVSGNLCRSVVGYKIKVNILKTRCWLNQTSLILIKIIFSTYISQRSLSMTKILWVNTWIVKVIPYLWILPILKIVYKCALIYLWSYLWLFEFSMVWGIIRGYTRALGSTLFIFRSFTGNCGITCKFSGHSVSISGTLWHYSLLHMHMHMHEKPYYRPFV